MPAAFWLLSSAYAQAPAKPKSIWQIQKVPLKGLLAVGVSADSANDVWVVGNGSLHFDGKTWTQVPIAQETGNPDLVLNSVAALSPSNVWALGFFVNNQGFDTEVIQHFDGKAWRNVKDLNLVGKRVDNATVLSEALVSIAALSPTDLWAAGYLVFSGGLRRKLQSCSGLSSHYRYQNPRYYYGLTIGVCPKAQFQQTAEHGFFLRRAK